MTSHLDRKGNFCWVDGCLYVRTKTFHLFLIPQVLEVISKVISNYLCIVYYEFYALYFVICNVLPFNVFRLAYEICDSILFFFIRAKILCIISLYGNNVPVIVQIHSCKNICWEHVGNYFFDGILPVQSTDGCIVKRLAKFGWLSIS